LTGLALSDILNHQKMNFYQSIFDTALVAILATGGFPVEAQVPGGPVISSVSSASEDTGYPQTGPISGYMDFHFNKVGGQDAILDFHRFVLLFTHSFSPRIRFVSELELEHALVEGLEAAGELELEQAYIDFLISREFNVRAGMLLAPIGIINERHEPPVFNGVERPFVDTVVIPTTWFDTGAGVHGEVGRGVRYRAYVMAPLDAIEFSADEGLRGGSQKGVESTIHTAAVTGRVEYVGTPDLSIGASFFSGGANVSLRQLETAVRVGEVDFRYQRDRFEARGQYAHVFIRDAGALNASVEQVTGVSPNVASELRGVYLEGAYRVWNSGPGRDLVAFARYENFDTQYRMPSGFLPLKEFDRDAWVVGLTYFPDPDIAVKADYVRVANQGDLFRTTHAFNLGLGWWF
jgi:hypothetical protein